MNKFVFIILGSFSVFTNTQCSMIPDEDYNLLPPLFHIDPYEKCVKKQNVYCRVSLRLYPTNVTYPSTIWKLIEQINQSSYSYAHDKLSHALCFEKNYLFNNEYLKKTLEHSYNSKYSDQGLSVTVDNVNCDNFEFTPGVYDYVVLCIFIFYCVLVVFATFYKRNFFQHRIFNKITDCFSLQINLRKTLNTYHQSPFGNLKCIQTIRFYTITLIIFLHVGLSFFGGYILNTKYVENLFENFETRFFLLSTSLLIQVNFLLSGWMLSYNTFKTYQKSPEINPYKFAILTLCNRFLRLLPNAVILVLVLTTIWPYQFSSGPVAGMYVLTGGRYLYCNRNWWITVLFLSNHVHKNEMCSSHLWYLSADTQLYTLSLICLVAIMKFPKSKILIMGLFLCLGVTIPSVVSYVYNLEISERYSPEYLRYLSTMGPSDLMHATYSSFYANMATYMVGMIFGYVCFRFENKKLFDKKVHVILWWICSNGLILTAFIAIGFRYNRLTTIILSGILKPLFALGVGLWILGISHRASSFITRVHEWKPTVFLGTFVYSIYIFHFELVFHKNATTLKPFELSHSVFLTSLIKDTILSFICGTIMYFIFEMPFSQLQSVFVPKPNRKPHLEEKQQ